MNSLGTCLVWKSCLPYLVEASLSHALSLLWPDELPWGQAWCGFSAYLNLVEASHASQHYLDLIHYGFSSPFIDWDLVYCNVFYTPSSVLLEKIHQITKVRQALALISLNPGAHSPHPPNPTRESFFSSVTNLVTIIIEHDWYSQHRWTSQNLVGS